MRKIVIFIMLVSITLFVGCGSKSNDGITEDKKNNEIVSNNQVENSVDEDNKVKENGELEKADDTDESHDPAEEESESKGQEYLDKYDQLEKELKESLEDKYSGTTIDMREAAGIEYSRWDDFLNEVYGVLQEQLSEEEIENVRTEQIEWLSIRDLKAEESAKEVEGGTMEPLVYTTSLAESTKERCYELITSYMITNNLSFTIPNKDEIAETTWNNISSSDKVQMSLTKEKFSVKKVVAENNSRYLLLDKSYEGKEVYLVTFFGNNASDIDSENLVDIQTYEIVGINFKE